MSYTLYEMAMNPDIQRKVQKEVDEAFKTSKGEITEEFINSLTFLEQCLMETTRVHCPVFQLAKISLKETEFPPQYENSTKPLKLAEETNVVIPVYALHL